MNTVRLNILKHRVIRTAHINGIKSLGLYRVMQYMSGLVDLKITKEKDVSTLTSLEKHLPLMDQHNLRKEEWL